MKEIDHGHSDSRATNANSYNNAVDEVKASDEIVSSEQIKLSEEALKKEDDMYAKLEAMFIAELNLKPEELPAFAKGIVPIPAPEKK